MKSPTAVLYTRERTLEVSIPRMCIQVVSWQLLPIEYPIIGIQYKLYKYSSASCGNDCRERRESKPKKPINVLRRKSINIIKEGIGSLKVVPGGVELRGQAAILDALIASSVRSRKGRNLVLESWSNFTASARAHDGRLLARFTLSEDRVDCVSKGFRITDPRGGVLFSADREQVVVGAATLKVTGVGGAVFRGSVQTPLVRAEPGHSLRLESATRTLEIKAPERVVIESRAGEILASCLSDLTLQSVEGAIRFDAKSVFLKDLKVGTPVQRHSTREQQQGQQQPRNGRSSSDQRESNIYQLCVCGSGKLFLARPEGVCQADKTIC
ncbi:Similar to Sgcz: Zeta-sarcoglycan (Mus musculus) [Cotesia congregata]|uniref:Similar to Sgcz: Zeta-sarcoglycan (Mus musculus) n=1 Tax=Cotesia congregata TaxID=51543 RepID=A0A8J2HPM0_COTCN|nr:Similar to Sgcz: Zeta-sarcoglycan (Mus musculus) [Cotesia congregata]